MQVASGKRVGCADSVETPGTANDRVSRPGRPWTSADERYLLRHRTDGADLLAHVLGRSPRAVRMKAHALGVSLRRGTGETCPECGCYEVRPGTAAARAGVCPVCWERRKAKAMEERAALEAERRRYDSARVRLQRARRG